MLILIGLVIEGSIQVRSVHGAPNEWTVKYATSEWNVAYGTASVPYEFLQEEGEFSFTVPADSTYSNPYSTKFFNSTPNGKVKYDLEVKSFLRHITSHITSALKNTISSILLLSQS